MVRSLFEHCSVVWRPTKPAALVKFETLQKRAVKWICCEPYTSYNDDHYLLKLKELDILPLGYTFLFTDLLLFHRIIHGNICIKLPSYLTLANLDQNPYYIQKALNLRPRNPVELFPTDHHKVFQCILPGASTRSKDPLTFHCDIIPRIEVNQSTYFIRCYSEWNKLPLAVRIEDNLESFKIKLKEHIWNFLIQKPD